MKFKLLTATSAESGEIRKAPSHIAAAKGNVQLIRCRETQLLLAGYTPTDMTTIDRGNPMGPTHTEGRSADEHRASAVHANLSPSVAPSRSAGG